MSQDTPEQQPSETVTSKTAIHALLTPKVIAWGIASFLIALMYAIESTVPMNLRAGLFIKGIGLITGTGLGTISALIGTAICQAIKPDAVFTNSFKDLLWQKIFWKIGPQVIGCFIGSIFGYGMPLYIVERYL